MASYLMGVSLVLMLILLSGLVRVMSGPTSTDRMLASQLFGTAGVAILMLLAVVQQQAALLNAALVLALLSPLIVITFVALAGRNP
ncbi:MAG: hypothetical protein AseanaTS_07360 [Candidatus Pelagadaptatus aseana]